MGASTSFCVPFATSGQARQQTSACNPSSRGESGHDNPDEIPAPPFPSIRPRPPDRHRDCHGEHVSANVQAYKFAPPSFGNATGITVLTMVLSSPSKDDREQHPEQNRTPLCLGESCDRIVHIARDAMHCKTRIFSPSESVATYDFAMADFTLRQGDVVAKLSQLATDPMKVFRKPTLGPSLMRRSRPTPTRTERVGRVLEREELTAL
ncbi:MAG: hypothetical protein ACR2II_05935 [Chthoniobacterales bacterium]